MFLSGRSDLGSAEIFKPGFFYQNRHSVDDGSGHKILARSSNNNDICLG